MPNLRTILKDEKWQILLDQAIYSCSAFVSCIMLARLLGSENFGLFMALVLLTQLLVSMTNALTINVSQTLLPKLQDKNTYLVFLLIFQLTLTAICLVILFTIIHLEIDLVKRLLPHTAAVLGYVAVLLTFDFLRKRLILTRNLSKVLILDTSAATIHLSVITFMLLLGIQNLATVISLSAMGMFTAILYEIFRSEFKIRCSSQFREYLRMHMIQGKWLLYTAALQWWSSNLFVLTSGALIGAAALGALRLIQSLFGVINIFLQAFENYTLPLASEKLSISVEKSCVFIREISIKSAGLLITLLLVMMFTAKYVILILGGTQFISYAFLVRGMALLYIIIVVGYPVRIAIRMLSFNRIFFTGYLLTFAFSLTTYSMLLNHFGILGAVIGLGINQIITQIYWQIQLYKNNYMLWK